MVQMYKVVSLRNSYRLIVACLIFLTACSKKESQYSNKVVPTEPSLFYYSPVDTSKLDFLLSLGWIQPVGHTIPTDHVYFWIKATESSTNTTVYAPAGGIVEKVLLVPVLGVNECKVWIQCNSSFTYYLDHVVLDSTVKESSVIKAGQAIGKMGIGRSIDLGAFDYTITQAFANTKRYAEQTVHCVKPFQYFTSPTKEKLYTLVDREGDEKDGWVNVDQVGKLSGNWFLDGNTFYTDGPTGWDKELSFAYDIQHPAKVLISVGGTLGMVGKWYIASDAPKPTEVSPSTGKVAYTLWSFDPNYPSRPGTQVGLMIVKMVDDSHIKVQVFNNPSLTDAEFDDRAFVYAR